MLQNNSWTNSCDHVSLTFFQEWNKWHTLQPLLPQLLYIKVINNQEKGKYSDTWPLKPEVGVIKAKVKVKVCDKNRKSIGITGHFWLQKITKNTFWKCCKIILYLEILFIRILNLPNKMKTTPANLRPWHTGS